VLQGANHDDVLKDTIIIELLSEGAWIVGLFCAVLLFIIYLTIRLSLRPLIEVSRQAQEIGPDTLDARLSATTLPREIAPLVTAFNGALDRLTEAYRVQRDFTANAAHELKTPLAVLRANLEAHGSGADGMRFTADLERLNRIITQLLRSAELDFLAPKRFVATDLHAIAVSVVGFVAAVVMEQGKEIEVIGEKPNIVLGDQVTLAHAVRNLVENAMQHAPEGSTISVDVASPAMLSVRDHGPGAPPASRSAIFRRFWRGSGEQAGHGAGLGLSIVQQIVTAHSGSIEVDNAPGGGALFTMKFPFGRPRHP